MQFAVVVRGVFYMLVKEIVSEYLGIHVYFYVEDSYLVKGNVLGERNHLGTLLVFSVIVN
jgi:hypothetical protein